MSDKCVCHINGYQIKDSIARKAIEDLQKAFDGLEIADGLDLEEIKQLIQNEIAKLDTTGLSESEVQELINSSWTTYEEPLINQKIEEAIAGVDTFTKEEAQEMHANMLNDINTSVNSKINEAVTNAEAVMDERIETALAGFEGGGSNAYNSITLSASSGTLSSEVLNSILNNPLNTIINIGGMRYIFSKETNTQLTYTKTQTGYTAGVVPYEIYTHLNITKSTGAYSSNSDIKKYYIPAPSSTNAGKVLAVKADGSGYEFIDV